MWTGGTTSPLNMIWGEKVDVNDDLAREFAFYTQALDGTRQAFEKLLSMKVRLIGYCVESCLFLVYEFIENGNLSQHLRGTGYEPLSWATRVRIALDSARGLEYIHEHIVPVYVHLDIKSANILIDKEFRAKVADFG